MYLARSLLLCTEAEELSKAKRKFVGERFGQMSASKEGRCLIAEPLLSVSISTATPLNLSKKVVDGTMARWLDLQPERKR